MANNLTKTTSCLGTKNKRDKNDSKKAHPFLLAGESNYTKIIASNIKTKCPLVGRLPLAAEPPTCWVINPSCGPVGVIPD
jgi:hypothetical protein